MDDFHGFPITSVSSAFLQVDCLATAGPRIVSLCYKGSPNLLAAVPSIVVPTPYGDYRYLGGHRLWHSPESMPRSYIPDQEGLTATHLPDGIALEGRLEAPTTIRKKIELRLDAAHPRLTLKHTLKNEGLWDVRLAPWAITMFRLGGMAILPIRAGAGKEQELLPDRRISLWPYTRINDARLHFEDEFVLVRSQPGLPPLKIGAFNPEGWTAYWVDGILFRKTFKVRAGLPHPDHDCNAEIYTNDQFIELESLGPLAQLEPGSVVELTETWELYDSLDQAFLSQKMREHLRPEGPT
jgi:hypothetical protein